jgi:hypothetical protein
LQKGSNPNDRVLSCWYSATSFDVDLGLNDSQSHKVSIYCLDWSSNDRSQEIEILEAGTGRLLNSQTVSGFTGGRYLSWNIKGNATIRLTRINGSNALIMGIFFDAAATSAPVAQNPVIVNGSFQLKLEGQIGQRFQIERSTDLSNWNLVETHTMTNSTFYFADPNAKSHPSRFYRAVLLP